MIAFRFVFTLLLLSCFSYTESDHWYTESDGPDCLKFVLEEAVIVFIED